MKRGIDVEIAEPVAYRLESCYFTGTQQGHNYQEFTQGVAFRLVAYALSSIDSLIYYRAVAVYQCCKNIKSRTTRSKKN